MASQPDLPNVVRQLYQGGAYRPTVVSIIRYLLAGNDHLLFVRPSRGTELSFPQGGIELEPKLDDANPEKALARELEEELVIDLSQLKIVRFLGYEAVRIKQSRGARLRGFGFGKQYFAYECTYTGDPKAIRPRDLQEVAAVYWIPRSDSKEALTTQTNVVKAEALCQFVDMLR